MFSAGFFPVSVVAPASPSICGTEPPSDAGDLISNIWQVEYSSQDFSHMDLSFNPFSWPFLISLSLIADPGLITSF